MYVSRRREYISVRREDGGGKRDERDVGEGGKERRARPSRRPLKKMSEAVLSLSPLLLPLPNAPAWMFSMATWKP